jgi:hypothetical protein
LQTSSQEFPAYVFYLAVPAFIAFWCVNCWLVSWQSGWRSLSKRFRAESEFLAKTKRGGKYPFDLCFRNWSDYTNIVWTAPEEDALYLSVVFPFRIAHPPLRIPWSEISIGTTKLLWRKYLVFSLGNQERIPMRVSERAARKLGILKRATPSAKA